MSFEKEPVIPGVSVTFRRFFLIAEAEVAENSGARRIGCRDGRAPMKKTARLIEIDGFGNISRNEGIVSSTFADTIHLNGQRDRHTIALEFASQIDGSRSTPAMTK